jgi:F-type H+-transporting ATPase subunit epsilon
MRLKVLLPTEVLVDREVDRVVAEEPTGHFAVEPRHVDYATLLEPGLLRMDSEDGEEFLGLAEGVLVKRGDTVLVSARDGVRGPDLGELKRMVAQRFSVLDEKERAARTASARMQAGFIRRFLELEKG